MKTHYSKTRMAFKGFSTFFTFIRLLPSQNSVMFSKFSLGQGLMTIISVIFLSSMNSLLYNSAGTLIKGYVTFSTFVRLLSSDLSDVCSKVEEWPTHVASLQSSDDQSSLSLAKGFATFSTFMRILSSMSYLIKSKACGMQEGFATFSYL